MGNEACLRSLPTFEKRTRFCFWKKKKKRKYDLKIRDLEIGGENENDMKSKAGKQKFGANCSGDPV